MLRSAFLLLALALVSGCASVAVTPSTPMGEPAAATPAARLAEEGRHLEAARAYAAEAGAARGSARNRSWLRAADQYWLAGDPGAAAQSLAQSNRRRLEGRDAFLHDLLASELDVAAGRHAPALARLAQSRDSVPSPMQARWHAARAASLEAAGRGFEAAGERAWMNESLDRTARTENLRRIDELLRALPDDTLAAGSAALPVGHPLYLYAGRALTQRGLPLPRPYDRSASAPGMDALPPADRDGYRPPERLAALLPLSGPLAAAGQSVRDGLLAGYYGENRRRPELRFYDTAGPEGVRGALLQAQADGAQMIVGPLGRDQVDALFSLPELALPVVALNRGSIAPPPGSTTFALAPEDEGVAAAERLLERGMRRILVVTQADESANRALASFRERLRAGGGEVIAEVVVSDANPDYVPALQQALAGGRPDGVFQPLRAAQARLLASQMDSAGMIGVARVATSLILSGANLRMDVELDGIEYPELPWLLGLRGGLPDAESLGRSLPSAQGGGARLFAFGLDAWKLSAYADMLARDPAAQLRGATGELQVDGFGLVQRRPAWAVFSGGRSRPALDGALLPDAGAP
ncbi:penicillin-binding protein activator [Arenimonas sp.]|uniref:penicillin-binding protein activator n=1 Tax=Arenimonas sp. TaxID=1872635 RepID=UPI002E321404|nr:penicillin-binding protein activator [Arenimonas sp.]HEX4853497.1 penicillin-binding protein activator [Arenimonas sp.]